MLVDYVSKKNRQIQKGVPNLTTFDRGINTSIAAQWVRSPASHAEGWWFEPQPRQTQVVKTGYDSSTAKRSAIGVSVTI